MPNASIARSEPSEVPLRELMAPPPEVNSGSHSMHFYWRLLYHHRWKIVALVAVSTGLAGLLALEIPKQYGATTMLRVDPLAASTPGGNDQPVGAANDAMLLTTTEAQVVTSAQNILAAAHQLHLDTDPYYRHKIGALRPGQSVDEALLQLLNKQISVTQPFNTELMNVHVEAQAPQLASDLANGLAQAYLDHEYRSRAQALLDSSRSMASQLDALRANMEKSQEALVEYEGRNDVLDADNKENIYSARLEQINQDLSEAESARIKLQADNAVCQSGDLDALLSIPRGQSLQLMNRQVQEDRRALARIGTVDGPRHPLYRQAATVLQHDEQSLSEEQQHIVRQVAMDYEDAVQREQLIREALANEKQAMDAFNMRAIQYHGLKAAADNDSNLYYSLQQHMQDAAVAATLRGEDLRIVSPARPNTKPTSPHPLLAAAAAFMLSLLVGIVAVITMGILDKSLTNPEQVEHWVGLPVMGMLPLLRGQTAGAGLRPNALLIAAEPEKVEMSPALQRRSSFHEAVTSLQSTISIALGSGGTLVLAVTSALPGEGKSTIAANLASSYAVLSGPAVLVDADMRKPSIHRILGLPNKVGLSTVLREKCALAEALVLPLPGLSVLPAGPPVPGPAELLHLRMGDLIEQLSAQFSTIIIDGPPTLGFADCGALVGLAHGTLLVVSAGRTSRDLVVAAKRQLAALQANQLVVVLNRVTAGLNPYYDYYTKHYESYYALEEAD